MTSSFRLKTMITIKTSQRISGMVLSKDSQALAPASSAESLVFSPNLSKEHNKMAWVASSKALVKAQQVLSQKRLAVPST
jgi:hypothetical protein